ncbi:hypothetical protein [Janthinobacterium fluminis]|uniref:DUF3999 domain-containing protein n=1 Tax=Janthinobacterium fluminis TaxID=2987524 RepID=A0ABT5K7D7_9BURK|nr:hypothetical protein [Janthinobacterium fluminis]MDC8759672.1 hypothetical protein [Janthinobacterium fluminis]
MKTGQRIGALAAFVAAALLFHYVSHLPVARPLDQAQAWTAETGEQLILRLLDEAPSLPVFAVEGADNEGVDVRFDAAAVEAATVASVRRDFHLDIPAAQGALLWTGKLKGNGHTMIEVRLLGTGGAPELQIGHIGEGSHPGLSLSTRHAQALVQLSVLLGDDAPLAQAEQKTLKFAAGASVALPGAVPINVVVPEGRRFTLLFPVEQPKSNFRLGEAAVDPHSELPLRDMTVRRPDQRDKFFVCAAGPDAHFKWPRGLRPGDCDDAPTLWASRFTLSPTNLAIFLRGNAYIVKDGAAESDDWLEKLQKNVPLAVLFSLLFGALGKWVWSAFSRTGEARPRPHDSGE